MEAKASKKSKIITICCFLVVVLVICFAYVGKQGTSHYTSHVRKNLTSISTNSKLPANGTDNIIFFRHDCPHCKATVPKAYVNNKLHHRNIQYRDIANHVRNYDLATELHVTSVPTHVKATVHNGKIIHIKQFKSLT